MTAPKDTDDAFIALLQQGITDILKNKKATKKERIDAIKAGTALMTARNKWGAGDEDTGGFFDH